MRKNLFIILFIVLIVNILSLAYALDCTDSDNGRNYNVKGTFSGMLNYSGTLIHLTNTDSCVTSLEASGDNTDSSNYLGEGYCENNELKVERITCPNGCVNGACVENNPVQNVTCTDSDDGNKIYSKGTISGTFYTGESFEGTDLCRDISAPNDASQRVSSCSGEYCVLDEYFCKFMPDSQYHVYLQDVSCPNGCSDGACIVDKPVQNITCTDSDNGRNYNIKGTFSGMYNGAPLTNTDSCVTSLEASGDNTDSSNYLGEGYCENNELKVERITCPNGCSNGVCLPKTEIKPNESTGVISIPNRDKYLCDGCELNNKCYYSGYRLNGRYCSDTNNFTEQKGNNIACENNFECSSNLCIDNQCVSSGLFARIIRWFQRLFG
ncbi:MAG: hypothetical protein KKE50_00030 [Nanoarchaeota archaeon]|nr:hypothetical protein [Nanoarchaeota archaeon]